MKLRGKTSSGQQRFQCLDCRQSYLWKNPVSAIHQSKKLLLQWLKGKTLFDLAAQARCSSRSMRRRIHELLLIHPEPTHSLKHLTHAVMDGTFLEGRSLSAFVIFDAKTKRAIAWEYGTKECQHDLMKLFERMRAEGCELIAATIDGHPAIARALTHVWPNIQIQRCLVHIQRQGLMWCRVNPKRLDAKKLRTFFLTIPYIETKNEATAFLKNLDKWESKYGKYIAQDPNHGWVMSDLKRARSMLLKAKPFLFQYLDDHHILKTTNTAEGFFSRFKGLLKDHRGMNKLHRQRAFEWFCVEKC